MSGTNGCETDTFSKYWASPESDEIIKRRYPQHRASIKSIIITAVLEGVLAICKAATYPVAIIDKIKLPAAIFCFAQIALSESPASLQILENDPRIVTSYSIIMPSRAPAPTPPKLPGIRNVILLPPHEETRNATNHYPTLILS